MTINILVTGAGGALAHTVIKALNQSSLDFRLFTTNSLTWGAALYVGERGFLVPQAKDDGYIPAIIGVCKKCSIDVLLVGTDHEILKLSRHRHDIERESGAKVIVCDPETLTIGYDKWVTVEFLRRNNLDFPCTVLAEDIRGVRNMTGELGFPIVVKPRSSSGSKGFFIARDEEDLRFATRNPEGLVVQEYLQGEDEEYTVGVVVSRSGDVLGSIGMKRVLLHGLTIAAVVDRYPKVQSYAEEIARKMRPCGVCNVQLRRTPRGPVCFEINPRFSSTDGQRAAYGFNAVEAVIRNYVLGEDGIDLSHYRRGFFARYWDELYVPIEDYEKFCETGETGASGASVIPEVLTRKRETKGAALSASSLVDAWWNDEG
ncbi:MAG: ATP-grasp domain-containing protein [Planctomycetota bacterium]